MGDCWRRKTWHLLALTDRIGGHESGSAFGVLAKIGSLHEPARYIIE
jgi:hypothetical protein